jgi:hypothetical protein
MMLGMLLAIVAQGCDAGSAGGPIGFAPSGTGGAQAERRPAPARRAVQRRPARQATDPGADALVESIREELGPAVDSSPVAVRVGVAGLRNQSHASEAEFVGLRLDLADLLTRSGLAPDGGPPIHFVTTDEDLDYELSGGAYLAVRDGIDQWELYLVLRPTGRAWVIWRAEGPIRMPRMPRPDMPQINLE